MAAVLAYLGEIMRAAGVTGAAANGEAGLSGTRPMNGDMVLPLSLFRPIGGERGRELKKSVWEG